MDWAALILWVLTAGGGFVLLAIWLKAGGMSQHSSGRIRPAVILTHFALAATGLVLWIVDRERPDTRPLDSIHWSDAVLIGIAQAAALLPGVSRSGATITAGRALALDRASAATFSFLMSMPIIAAAAVFKVPHLLRSGGASLPLLAGVIASAVSGWLAIAIVMRYVRSHSYGVFAAYRVVLGALVLVLVYIRARG